MNQEKKQEYTRRIVEANGTQMITILYEMTLDYLEDAALAMDLNDIHSADREINRAQSCVNELMHSVNLSTDLGINFFQIYMFARRQLITASAKRDKGCIDIVHSLFEKLKNSYKELEKYDDSPSSMEGAQAVFAGLTYGPGQLNETVSDSYVKRGYEA